MLLATLFVGALGTVVIYFTERHARGTEITTSGTRAFFTAVQLLTVSSQIQNPFTTWGRIADVILEIWAVIVVAGSAGDDDDRPDLEDHVGDPSPRRERVLDLGGDGEQLHGQMKKAASPNVVISIPPRVALRVK